MGIPRAKKILKELKSFNHTRVDPYFWMNQRDHKDVLNRIQEEQNYYNSFMKQNHKLQDTLFKEIKTRILEKEQGCYWPYKDYFYYYRFEEKKEYPIYCRRLKSDPKEEIFLDVNLLAKGYSYYDLGDYELSHSQKILAYAVDKIGRRFYTIHFKNLASHQILNINIPNVTDEFTWSKEDRYLFYVEQDPKTLRAYAVYRYDLKTHNKVCIYEEKDPTFSVGLSKSLSEEYIFILSSSTLTTEIHFLKSDQPLEKLTLFKKRKKGHRYFLYHGEEFFYIITNSNQCKNYRVDQTRVDKIDQKFWKTIVPHSSKTYIESIEVFKKHIAIEFREEGLTHIGLLDIQTQQLQNPFSFKGAYSLELSRNEEYDTQVLRYEYESMVELRHIYDYHLKTKKHQLIKKDLLAVPYNSKEYESKRLLVSSRDGVQIPISLVYRKSLFKKGSNPLYLYGYGSYGISIDPSFSSHLLSLLDRGFVFAIAHIRGGAEMGKQWQEEGRLLKKKNTFYDFIDCSQFLIKDKWSHPNKLYAGGGSAGGLLMGAILNMEPHLYKGIVAQVPFVDMITTMQDDSIPLTTGEYDEWGCPEDKEYYEYMLSYSPYDNVKESHFPNVLITSGYHDSQVQYWEPLKWASKLRDYQKADKPILLYMDMNSGHSGLTGRYQRLHLTSIVYTYLLTLEGITS